MTPADLRKARKSLGLTQAELAKALRMGKNGYQSVSRWETDGNDIPGPVQVAIECLLDHQAIPRLSYDARVNEVAQGRDEPAGSGISRRGPRCR